MEPIDVGIYSLLPPLIAITLALITKEVISSLMLGILSDGVIYCAFTGAGFMDMVAFPFEVMAKTVGTPDKFNIILFLALLGALVCVVTKAGGSQAYGAWATQKSAANGPQNLPPVFSVCSSSSMTISTASQSERL